MMWPPLALRMLGCVLHTDQIRAAFVARGVQAAHILDVKVVFHEGTDVGT